MAVAPNAHGVEKPKSNAAAIYCPAAKIAAAAEVHANAVETSFKLLIN
ncbi:hypothetical protein J6P59_01880 [bacterium]|nr:hypothetical protein [bacterium]MBO6095250.1 hypothetical protein [bacterium]MBO7043478.1 hypothetical protein [bacterium]